MIEDNFLDEMNLPLSSKNEDLETISNDKFKPLFDVTKFEIRSETKRDKGIDLHIEIKHTKSNNEVAYLNFRFAIQLKATDSEKVNNDGSISLQLDTGNINYLLNNPMPAFYILYFRATNKFYYENINDFAKSLYEKDKDWNNQPTHVLRFKRELDTTGLDEMYQLTLKKGKFQRTINEKTIIHSIAVQTKNNLIVDSDFNVSDDFEIRKLIESIGLELINKGKWKEILFVHKKASGNVASSAKYNLILGITHYYSGNLIDALSFFKTANKLKSELSDDLINHLLFFETTTKYTIGLLSDSDYKIEMKELENADNVGLYIKLEKAKSDYVESLASNSIDSYEKYVSDIQAIVDDPKANDSIILTAKCELILFEGYKNNMDYVKSVSMMNALEEEIGPNLQLRKDSVLRFIKVNESWFKNVQTLKLRATESKNYFAYFNAMINEVKITYEFEVYTDLVFIVQDLPGAAKREKPDKKPMFDRMLSKVTQAYEYFNQIGHLENIVASLSTKYEILHYLGDFKNANIILKNLEDIVISNDITEQKKKLSLLKKGGTTHEQFKIWIDKIFGAKDKNKRRYEKNREEMIRMDNEEKEIKDRSKSNNLHIHLFPIGYFEFPEGEKEQVYEILNATEKACVTFDNLFKTVIPIANIYYDTISKEGFVDGKLADEGFESWENIFRIRKAFYEKKYYRNEDI